MAEGAGLENRYMHPHIAGSNPALFAICPAVQARRRSMPAHVRMPADPAVAVAERCQSGLMGTPGKRVWVQAHRRFESCPLRHFSLPRLWIVLFDQCSLAQEFFSFFPRPA